MPASSCPVDSFPRCFRNWKISKCRDIRKFYKGKFRQHSRRSQSIFNKHAKLRSEYCRKSVVAAVILVHTTKYSRIHMGTCAQIWADPTCYEQRMCNTLTTRNCHCLTVTKLPLDSHVSIVPRPLKPDSVSPASSVRQFSAQRVDKKPSKPQNPESPARPAQPRNTLGHCLRSACPRT
jgi:hypothetical protein